jgi:hypothetical protein
MGLKDEAHIYSPVPGGKECPLSPWDPGHVLEGLGPATAQEAGAAGRPVLLSGPHKLQHPLAHFPF